MSETHFLVLGRVQHVGFRRFVARHAISLGVSGFVRNRIDGTVEVYASASLDKLNELIFLCNKGPVFASVTEVKFLPLDENLNKLFSEGAFKVLATE